MRLCVEGALNVKCTMYIPSIGSTNSVRMIVEFGLAFDAHSELHFVLYLFYFPLIVVDNSTTATVYLSTVACLSILSDSFGIAIKRQRQSGTDREILSASSCTRDRVQLHMNRFFIVVHLSNMDWNLIFIRDLIKNKKKTHDTPTIPAKMLCKGKINKTVTEYGHMDKKQCTKITKKKEYC